MPIVIATGIFVLLSLIGIILGAINYVGGPITYPTWVLAPWFVVDVILIVCTILYSFLFFSVLAFIATTDEGETAASIAMIGIPIVVFVAGGLMLISKHFAWVSLFAFFILLTCLIIDVLFLTAWLAIVRSKDE